MFTDEGRRKITGDDIRRYMYDTYIMYRMEAFKCESGQEFFVTFQARADGKMFCVMCKEATLYHGADIVKAVDTYNQAVCDSQAVSET